MSSAGLRHREPKYSHWDDFDLLRKILKSRSEGSLFLGTLRPCQLSSSRCDDAPRQSIDVEVGRRRLVLGEQPLQSGDRREARGSYRREIVVTSERRSSKSRRRRRPVIGAPASIR
jgi:hypothetical protein